MPIIEDPTPFVSLPSLLPPNNWPAIEARLDIRSRLEGYDSWSVFLEAAHADPSPLMGRRYFRIVETTAAKE